MLLLVAWRGGACKVKRPPSDKSIREKRKVLYMVHSNLGFHRVPVYKTILENFQEGQTPFLTPTRERLRLRLRFPIIPVPLPVYRERLLFAFSKYRKRKRSRGRGNGTRIIGKRKRKRKRSRVGGGGILLTQNPFEIRASHAYFLSRLIFGNFMVDDSASIN